MYGDVDPGGDAGYGAQAGSPRTKKVGKMKDVGPQGPIMILVLDTMVRM